MTHAFDNLVENFRKNNPIDLSPSFKKMMVFRKISIILTVLTISNTSTTKNSPSLGRVIVVVGHLSEYYFTSRPTQLSRIFSACVGLNTCDVIFG